MNAEQWVELIGEQPWCLGDLSEEQGDELLALLHFAVATREIAGRLADALSYLVYAHETGSKLPTEVLDATSILLTEAACVACREPRAERWALNS